jgi:hypothetical protein
MPTPVFAFTECVHTSVNAARKSEVAEKVFGNRLPHGRGSVSTCKHAVPILSRARKQAIFAFFISLNSACAT